MAPIDWQGTGSAGFVWISRAACCLDAAIGAAPTQAASVRRLCLPDCVVAASECATAVKGVNGLRGLEVIMKNVQYCSGLYDDGFTMDTPWRHATILRLEVMQKQQVSRSHTIYVQLARCTHSMIES